ncbi:MAG: hypothetical protein ABW122_08945 [Ilumatobacteraceae bacterium]
MGTINVGGYEIDLTLAVGPANSSSPVQEVTFSGSVTLLLDLEAGSNLQFVTRATSPEAAHISELATDVWLLGDIQQRFRAWAVWQEWFQNGQDNVSTMAVTYKKLLSRRLVVAPEGLSFTDTDLGSTIWGMWQHTQSQPGGNLGVTLGSPVSTGLVRTRTYKYGENLGQQAEDEYEEGMTWSIDQNLVYRANLIDAGPWIGTPLHLGANVRAMQRASGSDFANAVFGDADDATTTGVWRVAADVATDPRGRWELAKGWPTVKLQETLDDRTAAFLEQSYTPVAHWNIEMEAARWVADSRIMPGTFCVLVVPRSLAAPVGEPAERIVVLVTQLSVNFDEDGGLNINSVVMERPDIPLPISVIGV